MTDMVNMNELSKTEQQEVMDRDTTNINEAVAKKMGWEWKPVDEKYCAWVQGKKEMTKRDVGLFPFVQLLPPFSTDWNATKILIRWMRERGWERCAQNHNIKGGVWKIYFVWWKGDAWHKAEIIEDNDSLAACKAFLLIPDEDLEVKDGNYRKIEG